MQSPTDADLNPTQDTNDHAPRHDTDPIAVFQNHVNLDNQNPVEFPYKGLNPYTEVDNGIFFGRERDIQTIVNNLLTWRLTVLYGESGVGKSSVLRAGVAHVLHEEARQNMIDYGVPRLAVVIFPPLEKRFSWKDEPLTSLIQRIQDSITDQAWGISSPDPELPFMDTLQAWTQALGGDRGDGQLYLILDQFEEYFLYHAETKAEDAFFREFPGILKATNLRVNVLLSIREDAIATLDHFKSSIPGLFDHRWHLGYLDGCAAKNAIIKPIHYYNQLHHTTVEIEPALVNTVLDEVQLNKVMLGDSGMGGAIAQIRTLEDMQIKTPYLQMVMERLWREERDQGSELLRLETFEKLGKAGRIVRDHLNQQMDLLTEEEQAVAAEIFQYLITPSGVKYAYCVNDLVENTECNQADIRQLLEKLASGPQRILRPSGKAQDEQPDTQPYEIFHDALAPAILDWRRQYLEDRERAKELAREQRKRARELAKQRTKMRRQLALVTGIAILSTALFLGTWTWRQLDTRQQELRMAEAVQQGETGSQLLALKEAMNVAQAVKQRQLGQAKSETTLGLQKVLNSIEELNQFQALAEGIPLAARSVVNAQGSLVATTSLDGRVSIWTLNGKKLIDFQAAQGSLVQFTFLQDGQRLATASWQGEVAIWNLEGKSLATLNLPQEVFGVVAFSPDGLNFATVGRNSTVQIWTLQGKKLGGMNIEGGLLKATFSPSGQQVVTISPTGKTVLWDLQGHKLTEFKGHQGAVFFAKFGPKGEKLITSGQDGTVREWNLNGQLLRQFTAQYGPVYQLGVSADAQRIATASMSGNVRIWDDHEHLLAELKGHENLIDDISFDPDGHHLATITTTGTVRLWNILNGKQNSFQASKTFSLNHPQIRFSYDNQALIISTDQEITRWNLKDKPETRKTGLTLDFMELDSKLRYATTEGQGITTAIQVYDFNQEHPLATFPPPSNSLVWDGDISPDGRWLATVAFAWQNSQAQIWDIQHPQEAPQTIVPPQNETVIVMRFSHDGTRLATVTQNGWLSLWDTQNLQGEPLGNFRVSNGNIVSALEFSTDGQHIALATWNNTASLWDLTGHRIAHMEGHHAPVRNIHFSKDGQRLLTSSLDGTARLWDLQGHQWAEYPGPQNSGVMDAALSSDGKQIAVFSLDGYAQLWPVEEFDQLVMKGCNWLTDYYTLHRDEKPLEICKPYRYTHILHQNPEA